MRFYFIVKGGRTSFVGQHRPDKTRVFFRRIFLSSLIPLCVNCLCGVAVAAALFVLCLVLLFFLLLPLCCLFSYSCSSFFLSCPQVQFRQIGPGMVQQLQSACSTCRGEGKVINERDKCKSCNAKKVRVYVGGHASGMYLSPSSVATAAQHTLSELLVLSRL